MVGAERMLEQGTVLYDTAVMDTQHQTFVQIHGMHSRQRKQQWNDGLWVIMMCQRSSSVTNIMGGDMWGSRVYMGNFYTFPSILL